MRLLYSLTRLKTQIIGLKETIKWLANTLRSPLKVIPLDLESLILEREGVNMGIEDMQDNEQINNSKSSSLFARCDLSWFKANLAHDGNGQRWEIEEYDPHGPTVIKVHRTLAKRVEWWYRISYTKTDGTFEKRMEYPEGVDADEQY